MCSENKHEGILPLALDVESKKTIMCRQFMQRVEGESMQSREKRKFSRVPFRLKAFVNSRATSIKGEVENLSINGMLLATEMKLQAQDPVDITIYLSGTENPLEVAIRIQGTVVRTENRGIVLQFMEMDPDSFGRLKNIIAFNAGNEDQIMQEVLRR